MNDKSRVSILMPVYNCERYISDAIESIINQTIEDWELLIADDCSLDATRAIIDRYTDVRIRKIHNEAHIGVVRTRNKLLAQARGEYIVWQDADDTCADNRLAKLLGAFEADPELIVCGSNCVRVSFLGRRSVSHYPLTHIEIKDSIAQQRFPFVGATVAVKRAAIKKNLLFREFFSAGGEDVDWLLRLTEVYKAANLPDALYYYRYRRNSLSRSITVDNIIKLNAMRIAFFLAQQRAKDAGLDGLMEGGDKCSLEAFINRLKYEYERDKSIIYRQACLLKIVSHDYLYALRDAYRAVITRPDMIENYMLIYSIVRSFIKTNLTVGNYKPAK